MKTELVILERKHLEALGEKDFTQNSLRLSGPGFCLLVDDEPIAAGGLGLVESGHGVAWTVMHEKAKKSHLIMRRIHKHVKEKFALVCHCLQITKISAEAAADRDEACRWLEHLGFKPKPVIFYEWSR